MRYDGTDFGNVYEDFLEVDKNQIMIFEALLGAISSYCNLEGFIGTGAEASDNYFNEVHTQVVDSFNIAIMEMEIRLNTLQQDFTSTVDNSTAAILDMDYITDTRDKLTAIVPRLDNTSYSAENAVNTALPYMQFDPLPYYQLKDRISNTVNKINDVLYRMEDFNERHKHDLDRFNEMFAYLDAAFAYMATVIGAESVAYVKDSSGSMDWARGLALCREASFMYASVTDPNLEETFYWAVVTQAGLDVLDMIISQDGVDIDEIYRLLRDGKIDDILSYSVKGGDATDRAVQALKLYLDGLCFAVVEQDGIATIRIQTFSGKFLEKDDLIRRLYVVGADSFSEDAAILNAFFSKNGSWLPVVGNDLIKIKPGIDIDWLEYAEAQRILKAADFVSEGATEQFLDSLKTFRKIFGGIGAVSSIAALADAFYDERTETLAFENVEPDELAAIVGVQVVDVGVDLGLGALLTAIAGPIVGPIAGAVASIGFNWFANVETGEPPKSLYDSCTDGLEDVIEGAGAYLQRLFW